MGNSLIQSPIFQTNLIMWLAWYPLNRYKETGINPVFNACGFRLFAISPKIVMPVNVQISLRGAGLQAQASASPDVLLISETIDAGIVLPIECKRSSFSIHSTTAEQAYVLATCVGRSIARDLGLNPKVNWDTFVLYALPKESQDQMGNTLSELSFNAQNAGVDATKSGTLGLEIADGKLWIEPHGIMHSIPVSTLSERTEIIDLNILGPTPTPLYLIPLDPSIDINDSYGKEVLEQRLRSSLVSHIGSKLDDEEFDVLDVDIVSSAVIVWDQWKDTKAKQGLMRIVRTYVRQVIQQLKFSTVKITYEHGVLSFTDVSTDAAFQIRRYLASSGFRQGKLDWELSYQRTFDELEQDW